LISTYDFISWLGSWRTRKVTVVLVLKTHVEKRHRAPLGGTPVRGVAVRCYSRIRARGTTLRHHGPACHRAERIARLPVSCLPSQLSVVYRLTHYSNHLPPLRALRNTCDLRPTLVLVLFTFFRKKKKKKKKERRQEKKEKNRKSRLVAA